MIRSVMEKISTGVAGLDQVLLGGLYPQRLYLLEGDPGVGKTTLALQFLLAGLKAGERGLYITLSETEEEVRTIAHAHGWNLDGLSMFELSALEQQKRMDAENTIFRASDVELTETTQAVLQYVDQIKPDRVVFDSLSELRLLAHSALRYRREVLNLKTYFSSRKSTIILLDDRTSDPGDQQLQSLAHGVISLQQHAPDYGADRRRMRIVKMRGSPFRGGYHDMTITTGGVNIFPRLVAAEHHSDFVREPVPSGIPGLDRLMGGGIDRGTGTLILGNAGTGKSSIVAQYATTAAKRGERSVIFGFDELHSISIHRADTLGMEMSKHVASGAVTLQQVDPAELSPGELVQRVVDFVERDNVKLIAIDTLNGYLHAMPADQHLYVQLHELLSYLGQRGITTMLVMAQVGTVGVAQSPVEISYIADNVLLLRYFESHGRIRKAISVVKKRTGPHEDTIREMTVNTKGIHIGDPLTEFSGVLTGVPQYHGTKSQLSKT